MSTYLGSAIAITKCRHVVEKLDIETEDIDIYTSQCPEKIAGILLLLTNMEKEMKRHLLQWPDHPALLQVNTRNIK